MTTTTQGRDRQSMGAHVTQPAPTVATGAVVHIAAPYARIGIRLRQRCLWCGAVLLDYDLDRTASPCGEACQAAGCQPDNHRPATWPAGSLVEVEGNARSVVPHEDGADLPANACALIDDEVTV